MYELGVLACHVYKQRVEERSAEEQRVEAQCVESQRATMARKGAGVMETPPGLLPLKCVPPPISFHFLCLKEAPPIVSTFR